MSDPNEIGQRGDRWVIADLRAQLAAEKAERTKDQQAIYDAVARGDILERQRDEARGQLTETENARDGLQFKLATDGTDGK